MNYNLTELIRKYVNTTDEAEAQRLLVLINARLDREGKLV